ncbi:MAG: DUF4124 domain-containing protein [Spongiibacteraceae bacterium]
MGIPAIKLYSSLLVLTLLISPVLSAKADVTEVYKTVDKQGKVSFSDTPQPNADKVEIQSPNAAEALKASAPNEKTPAPSTAAYDTLKINSPANDAIIANGLIAFTVSTQVNPKLAPEHKLQLNIDGALHSISKSNFQIDGISRGPHQLQIEVIDDRGNTVQQSSAVKIFVYRPGK